MRFYGMSLRDYQDLDVITRNELWEAITVIEAREMLNMGSLLMWPHIEHEARVERHRDLHSQAYPETHNREDKYITPEQLQARLAGRLNG